VVGKNRRAVDRWGGAITIRGGPRGPCDRERRIKLVGQRTARDDGVKETAAMAHANRAHGG